MSKTANKAGILSCTHDWRCLHRRKQNSYTLHSQ